MKLKILSVALLALACFVVAECWVHLLQPELTVDIASQQMERSEEPARLVRVSNQVQQWPFMAAALVVVVGGLLILLPRGEDRQGSHDQEVIFIEEEETQQ